MAVVISERLLDGSDRLLDTEADEQLVRLVQAGHDAAFAAIVRRYERELKAHAHRLTSDGRAEDAVQQALLNAFAALRGGGEVRHLRGWLHHILRNEVTRARLPLEAPLDAAAVSGETLEDTVQLRATAHAVLAHLSALPERQRDALLGTAVLGFPRAQVARTMGLSEGAVRQLVHRARLRLRQAASALIPLPLVKLLSAARSGVDAAPDAALGAGTAVSGGVVVKVGALLASGVVATGIAVSQSIPARHHAPASAHGAGHGVARTPASPGQEPTRAPSLTGTGAAPVTHTVRLAEPAAATTGTAGRSPTGRGRPFGTRPGRDGGPGSGRGRRDGRRGGDGSGRSGGGASGPGHDATGSQSQSGTRWGSGSSGDGSGARSGSSSGGADPSGSGSLTRSGGSGGSSGSGSGDGAGSRVGGSGGSGAGDGGLVSTDGVAGSNATSGGGGSDGGGSGDLSGSGSTGSFGGSRDLSRSLDSSSS